MTLGRSQAQPYILGCWRCWRWSACSRCLRLPLASFASPTGGRRSDHAPHCRSCLRRHRRDRCARTCRLCQPAYLALTGADRPQGCAAGRAGFHRQPRCLGGGVSPAEGRARRQAAAGGGPRCGPDGVSGRWLRMRVRPLGADKRESKFAVWSIADITRDRERQEDVFQELQHAIEYLDHAPSASSRSMRAASWSMSMRRWPTGSTTISRRSVPAD